MFFASDNGGPVHPRIMAALAEANEGHAMPYGACPWTARAVAAVREAFGAPEAEVRLVPTGTSANALLLGSLTEPWRRVFCSDIAHVHMDEMGAVAFYGGGAELGLVPQSHGRIAPDALDARIAAEPEGRRGPVSVTQVTEAGTVYDLDTLCGIAGVAERHGLPLHIDGARFANACAALGVGAADMAQGAAAVSFGGTKNGAMGVEAAVLLDPSRAPSLAARRHRGGHLFSKHRYLAAQIAASLEDGLWLEMAAAANARMARLAEGLRRLNHVEILHPVDANILFARWPDALHDRLAAEGALYYRMPAGDGRDTARLVCDWSVDEAAIDRFLSLMAAG